MALQAMPDEELRLRTWGDVQDHAAEKDALVQLYRCTPGMRVSDDRFIQTEDRERIYVSGRGWAALCRSLGCDLGTLERIEAPGLATKVLNDAWNRSEDRMTGHRIVVDGWTVVGVVGSRYQTYKHGQLVEVIDEFLESHGKNGWANVRGAWTEITAKREIGRTIGTELRIILPLREYKHPTRVKGLGGTGPDVSWVGVEARNGLSGDSSVGVRTTVFRLVCANGMVRAAAEHKRRVSHTGEPSKLDAEVKKIFGKALDGLDSTVKWLNTLGTSEFDAEALADDRESMRLVQRMLKDLDKGYWSRKLTSARKDNRLPIAVEEMANRMAGRRSGGVWRSGHRSNATWWDFVNIFTEAAQGCEGLGKQLRVEEQAGYLAERLAQLSG